MMCQDFIGTLSTLAGTALGGVITYCLMLQQHRHDDLKERRVVAREKLELAIASVARIPVCLRKVQRINFSLQQHSTEPSSKEAGCPTYAQVLEAETRADMEESLLKLEVCCVLFFHDAAIVSLLKELKESAREAYANACSPDALERVEERVDAIISPLRAKAKEYEA